MEGIPRKALVWGVTGALLAVPAAWTLRRIRRRGASGAPGYWVRVRPAGREGAPAAPESSPPLVQRWVFDAPRERVYAYWTAFSSFPDFMDSVEDVRPTQPGCYRIRLRGPGGESTVWEVALERMVPGERVEWSSSPDSPVQCAGRADFLPLEGGGTLVELRLDRCGASRWLAEGMDHFLRAELPSLLGRDVLRMKELIETGSAEL